MLRAGRSVWAALKPNGSAVRLGITADAVAEVGLTRDKAFADLAAPESIMLPQRPFAMVEGPLGVAQLESPLAGLVAARNLSVIDDPGVLFDRAECVVDGWLARSHGVVARGRIAITF